ncbi:caspase recruitment domain-containing protein 14-like isoform X2 [Liolophura sinensis]|uniref:caspase recruitment domain-containing protein 14-like isoform X2 n=1 Tax=Liolophura sinensis TaxID=3198878 RepID=UPI0031596A4D
MAYKLGEKVTVGRITEENWEDVLRQNYMVLTRIRPGYIVDILFQERVLNEEDRDEIRCLTTPRKQAVRLLDLLPSKGYKSFLSFLKMLENEYPDIYQTVTGKEAVKKPGYNRLDRWSSFLEHMPEVFSKLRSEMKNSKTLADSLHQLQQSVELMKQEKADLERDLEMSRLELIELPQLRRDFDVLYSENEKLRNENHDRTKETLACIHERDRAERKCRELQGDVAKYKSELGKLRGELEILRNAVEMVTMERDKEKRRTRNQERITGQVSIDEGYKESVDKSLTDSVRLQLEHEIDILRESERELQDEIHNVAQELLKTRTNLHQVEEELRRAIAEREKSQQALGNSEENYENIKIRCNDIWHQVDELRQEKDKAMESQHFYLNMYNKVSLERDRLSSQLKKLESQYDDTKKQLDKLKQDMRSSLQSSNDSVDFNDTVHQWINRLEEKRLFGACTGTSSSEVSELNDACPGLSPSHGVEGFSASATKYPTLGRTDTVSAEAGDAPGNKCLDPDTEGREVVDRWKKRHNDYVLVSREDKKEGRCFVTLPKAGCSEVDSDSGDRSESNKCEGSLVDFYIRCDQDYDGITDEELSYKAGEILRVTDISPGDRKDAWLAHKVNTSTGSPCIPKVEGIIKSGIKLDRPLRNTSIDSQAGSILSRRDAMKPKKAKPEDNGLYTFVSMESVTYKRPVLFSGPRNVAKSLSEVLARQGKCTSWFSDDAHSKCFEMKLASVVEKDQRIILPPGSLSTCHTAKLYPICIRIKAECTGENKHLMSLLGNVEEDSSPQDDSEELREMGLTATQYRTFRISEILTPTCEDLVNKIMTMVDEMQLDTVWRPTQKLPTISLCSTP